MSAKAAFLLALAGSAALPAAAGAAINYSVAGSTYSENFNSLPLDAPNSANIETVYADGWQDDVDYVTSAEDDVSVLGWHLYHPTLQTEGGFNGHQRLRMGTGNSAIGSFYGFALPNAATPEKALGAVGSSALAGDGSSTFMGLQLINTTGQTLTSFALTYDGEQWRDSGTTTDDTLAFAYSLAATDDPGAEPWHSGTTYTAVPALNFTPPVNGATGAGVDGNTAGLQANITATVTGINWAPGAELWLRWKDTQVATADDGTAIDNVRFEAFVPEPGGLMILGIAGLGLLRRPR